MNELEKLKDYLDNEYRMAVAILTRPQSWYSDPERTKTCAIVRGLGAVMFAQELGISYEEVNPIYEEYKKCIEDIIVCTEREVRI